MKHFSDKSCAAMLAASVSIDKAATKLDELPESERLTDIIDQLAAVTAKLDDILKDEEF